MILLQDMPGRTYVCFKPEPQHVWWTYSTGNDMMGNKVCMLWKEMDELYLVIMIKYFADRIGELQVNLKKWMVGIPILTASMLSNLELLRSIIIHWWVILRGKLKYECWRKPCLKSWFIIWIGFCKLDFKLTLGAENFLANYENTVLYYHDRHF
jgi:hypothetical protein